MESLNLSRSSFVDSLVVLESFLMNSDSLVYYGKNDDLKDLITFQMSPKP